MHVTREATKLDRYRHTVRSRSASANLIFLRNEKKGGKKIDDWGLEDGGSRREKRGMRVQLSQNE